MLKFALEQWMHGCVATLLRKLFSKSHPSRKPTALPVSVVWLCWWNPSLRNWDNSGRTWAETGTVVTDQNILGEFLQMHTLDPIPGDSDSVALGEGLKCKYFDNDLQLMLVGKCFLHRECSVMYNWGSASQTSSSDSWELLKHDSLECWHLWSAVSLRKLTYLQIRLLHAFFKDFGSSHLCQTCTSYINYRASLLHIEETSNSEEFYSVKILAK